MILPFKLATLSLATAIGFGGGVATGVGLPKEIRVNIRPVILEPEGGSLPTTLPDLHVNIIPHVQPPDTSSLNQPLPDVHVRVIPDIILPSLDQPITLPDIPVKIVPTIDLSKLTVNTPLLDFLTRLPQNPLPLPPPQ